MNIFKKILFAISMIVCMTSCSDDNKIYDSVRVVVESSSNEQIILYGIPDYDSDIKISGQYETTFNTDADFVCIRAKCYDMNTSITIKVWVNGELKDEATGIKWVYTEYIPLK